MQRIPQTNSKAIPVLSKRNDSFIYVKMNKSNTDNFYPPLQESFSPFILSPPNTSFGAHSSSFGPHSRPFPEEFPMQSRVYAPSKNMEIAIMQRVNETNKWFFQNLDQMEPRIFGRKLPAESSGWRRADLNDNQTFNLNFTPDFEKLNDSSYMFDHSIGAEDSPMMFANKSRYSRKNFLQSKNRSKRSTIEIKNKVVPKSIFLNDLKIENNFNGVMPRLKRRTTPKLKKVKSSRNVKLFPQMGNLSEDNEDDMKTVLNKFKSDQQNNGIIRPKVFHRRQSDKFGSKRTVQSGKVEHQNSTFKIPQMSLPKTTELNSRSPPDSLYRVEREATSRGFQFGPKSQFSKQRDQTYFSGFDPSFDELKNTLFEKIPGNDTSKKSKKGQAANHIYKIMKNMSKIIYDRTLRRDKSRLKRDIENCLEEVDIEMNHLIGLKNLLSKFMKEEPITHKDMDLSNLEVLLFCLFLVKKRYLDLEALRWTPDCLNQFRNQEMLKRSEQNYKVVLKRAFKTLISTFNAENSILGGNEQEFYEYYFGRVSREFNISIDSFKPQQIFNEIKTGKQSKKFEKRKSKKEFASMLKKSDNFMNLLQNYLKDDLVINGKNEGIFRDCMKELDRKLPLMIFNWQKRLGNENNFKNEFIKFLVDTLINDKVKLPWSASEVRRGVSSVLRLFRKA